MSVRYHAAGARGTLRRRAKGPTRASIQPLNQLLTPALAGRAEVRVQAPFAASDDSEPEPDLLVAPPGDYAEDHPHEAWLIVEVAQSSLARDQATKRDLYAASGVREYWVIDLTARTVSVYLDPAEGRYRTLETLDADGTLAPSAFPDLRLPVADLLPHPSARPPR